MGTEIHQKRDKTNLQSGFEIGAKFWNANTRMCKKLLIERLLARTLEIVLQIRQHQWAPTSQIAAKCIPKTFRVFLYLRQYGNYNLSYFYLFQSKRDLFRHPRPDESAGRGGSIERSH